MNINELKKLLKELKFEYQSSKPYNYDILKPHIKSQVDKELKSIMKDKIEPTYEGILDDTTLELIAKQQDYKLSSDIYDLIIIDKYKSQLYNKLPNNHPIKKSTKVLLITTICFTIIGLITGLVIKNEIQIVFMFLLVGFTLGLFLGSIFQKIFRFFKNRKTNP
jgi:hypothetical protein